MIESRLLVAKKPFAFLLNQSRSGEATVYTTAPLPRLASGKASTLLAQRLKVLFARSKSFPKDQIQQKSRILSAADMRLLGDHIMP
jgi:hypothetical protein